MRKEDFTLCKSPLSFNLNFRSLVIRMGSQSDSVGILSDSAGIPLYRKRKTLIISNISLLYKNYSLISCRKKIDFFQRVTHL